MCMDENYGIGWHIPYDIRHFDHLLGAHTEYVAKLASYTSHGYA